mmetsp:Transcript_95585/g.270451  ORF Transcript_95585/g.270451 Transcript_95585/m.270451 type:complete len:251 (+) Transcript_95585:693-1445(+)
MNEVDARADAGQHQGFFHGSVPAADDRARLALEQVPVASSAAGDAEASVLPFALGAEPSAVGTGGDDESVSLESTGPVRHNREGTGGNVQRYHGIVTNLGEEAARLLFHNLDHLPAVLAGHARVILHVHALGHQLPSQCRREDERAKVGASRVDGRCHTSRPAADDDDFLGGALRAVSVEAARVVGQASFLLLHLLHGTVLLAALQLLPKLFQRRCVKAGARGTRAFAGARWFRGPLARLALWDSAVLLL